MFKLYNTQASLARDLSNFFKNISPNISKPHLKIIPYIILGMIQSESVVTSDIVKMLKGDFSFVSPFSSIRKLERFFNNPKFDVYSFYHSMIRFVISNFKSKNYNLIFLADRWFNFREIMQHIDSLSCTYCIRTKTNVAIEIDNVVSKTVSHHEPFFIFTNGSTRLAIKHYRFRFGSIESIFKNQKSNGFYLESTKMRNIHSFSTLFGLMCGALLWLTVLGSDYSKNKNHFKNYLKIRCSKRNGDRFRKTMSLFNTGLFFFHLAFCCPKPAIIKCNFMLYDV